MGLSEWNGKKFISIVDFFNFELWMISASNVLFMNAFRFSSSEKSLGKHFSSAVGEFIFGRKRWDFSICVWFLACANTYVKHVLRNLFSRREPVLNFSTTNWSGVTLRIIFWIKKDKEIGKLWDENKIITDTAWYVSCFSFLVVSFFVNSGIIFNWRRKRIIFQITKFSLNWFSIPIASHLLGQHNYVTEYRNLKSALAKSGLFLNRLASIVFDFSTVLVKEDPTALKGISAGKNGTQERRRLLSAAFACRYIDPLSQF